MLVGYTINDSTSGGLAAVLWRLWEEQGPQSSLFFYPIQRHLRRKTATTSQAAEEDANGRYDKLFDERRSSSVALGVRNGEKEWR